MKYRAKREPSKIAKATMGLVAMTPILPAGLPIIATAFIAIAVGLRR